MGSEMCIRDRIRCCTLSKRDLNLELRGLIILRFFESLPPATRERCLSWTLSQGKYNDNDIIKEDMVLVSCSHYGNAFFVIAGFCCKQTVPYEDIHDDDDDDDDGNDDDDDDSDDDNDDDDGGDDAADDDEGDDDNDVNAERVGLVVYYI